MTSTMSYIAPDGYKYREVAQHPFEDDTDDRVGVIIKDKSQRLLVVRGETGKYSLPKGCRHRGETEWEGALRELWEETGLDLENEESVKYRKKLNVGYGVYFKFRVMKTWLNIQIGVRKDEYEKIKEVLWIKPQMLKKRHYQECNADLKLYIKGKMNKMANKF